MEGYSQTPKEERIKILQSVMPEIFDEGKIDWEKLRATLGEDINFVDERYRLNWAGKSDAFRVMQEASASTLVPCREESVDFDDTQNIFIEGENMEVLKVLQKSYFSKVKMIYIDPPYNTGNDSFIYPDRFAESREEYMRRVGDKDDEGYMLRDGMFRKNSKENGQYHSNWLNMMMPRLYLAKSLLREDGVIFISIDENESHNLRLLMNEIFGEENFLSSIVWEKRFTRSNNAKTFTTLTEQILVYRKSDVLNNIKEPRSAKADSIYSNPDNDPRGDWTSVSYVNPATKEQRPNLSYSLFNPITQKEVIHPTNAWKYEKTTYEKHIKENRLYWGKNGENAYPRLKKFLSEMDGGMVPVDLWKQEDTGTTDQGSKELEALMGGKLFDFPKPVSLIKRALSIIIDNEETTGLFLDFFAGTAPTAQAIMELNQEDGGNRKYICVQLPELCVNNSEAAKAGYATIADIAKERIRRVGAKIRAKIEAEQEKKNGQLTFEDTQQSKMPDLGFKVFKLADSNFKQWRKIRGSETKAWQQQVMEFIDPVAENATVGNMVYELLLKSGKDLNSTIEHKNGYYVVNDRELIMMMESATQETVDAVLATHPEKVIALDRLFEGNDQLKTNTVLQMKDAGITFITI
ncbi:site-specific DNA-methyltransferase [Alistipes communis]|jgi:type III restriction-modification system methyltransferase|uniref:site-specific DNA-methyltransferase n=1 Tax=Alistipes communis TaxID=2585118 RepID=UPI001D05E4D6|nr:site-specific DNA-methyltransferase [Alistipes communis]MCB6996557.1 site-specific DNA-methyltransferase [Alistipes communis]